MIQAIIFDFDGVLVDSECANVEAAIKTFNDIGKPLSGSEINSIPGKSSMDFIPLFSKGRGIDDPTQYQTLYETNRENYNRLWENVVTMPNGTKETIETLRAQGKKLAIATTNRRETVKKFFMKFGMHDKFSVVVTDEDVKNRKPDPEVYLIALEQLGFPKENVIAVEDTSIGLLAAKSAGIRCMLIPSGYMKGDNFPGADFIFSSMRELLTHNIQ